MHRTFFPGEIKWSSFVFFIYDVVGKESLSFSRGSYWSHAGASWHSLAFFGMSMHRDTELPVWQPRSCNIVCHWGRWWWLDPSHSDCPTPSFFMQHIISKGAEFSLIFQHPQWLCYLNMIFGLNSSPLNMPKLLLFLPKENTT